MDAIQSKPDLPPPKRRWFQFKLRTLLLFVALIAAMIPACQVGWRWLVLYRDHREYTGLQATRDAFFEKHKEFLRGSSFGVGERPVPDGFVVLVRQGNVFGCFIPREQMKKGESLKFEWFYRTDGLGVFDASDPNVHSGEGFAGPYSIGKPVIMAFGPFSIKWSGHESGWGYVYYDYEPRIERPLRVCTTSRKTLQYLDACSPEWIYKVNNQDVGLPGNEKAR